MTANKVTQKGAAAGRDMAGRDINISNTTIESPNQTSEVLKSLYEKYKHEKETQTTTDGFIQDLSDYYKLDDESILRDLAQKLNDAGREDLLSRAYFFKQSFRQKIEKYRLLPAAQEIYAFLLGLVLTRFYSHATPAINNGMTGDEVTALIQEDIVEFIMASIPGCEPMVDHPTLHGMIYFLTGNCFVEWEKK